MADSLYFKSGNNFIKTANLNSPSFIGTPTVPTPTVEDDKRIVDVEFIKNYIDLKLKGFNTNTIQDNSNTLTLSPNKKYIIHVYGFIDIPEDSTTNIKLGYIAITNSSNTILAKSGNASSFYKSTGGLIQSGSLIITSPANGIVKGYVNYGGTLGNIECKFMCALELVID